MSDYISKCLIVCVLFFSTTFVNANEVKDIDNQELKEHMQQGVAVIDVRTTSEWKKTGVVEGSHLIMFYNEQGKYDLDAWLVEVAKVANKGEPVILICDSGGRSKQLAEYLTSAVGYKEVYNVKRGISHWIKQKNIVLRPN